MCGFAGFVNFDNQSVSGSQRCAWLQGMGAQLARRGPDDQQVWDQGALSFVFRRLAIVDVAGGQQPIWNEDGTIFVAVNGEIYNHWELRSKLREPHRFRTHSDAEIVLHLYEEQGPAALPLLNGMFAIALWDTTKQQLFLARDRLGIKPLYYAQVGSQLIFGSELKAMLVHPDCPNHANWWDLKTPMPRSSFVKGVDLLSAGHYALYDQSETFNPTCYWSIEQFFTTDDQAGAFTPQDYVAQYRELFADSVQKRLMSEVPMGMFLSGGVDSAAIAAVAAQQCQIQCFTVVEPCTILTGDALSAQRVANHLHLPFHPVSFDSAQLVQQLEISLAQFEYFIWMMDAPRFDLEWFFKHELHRYAKTAVPELKVMLLGQGADEFAGGYSNPVGAAIADWQAYLDDLKSTFHGEMLHRVMQLQIHNLWHEDRTASSQGIESRVPFLDHRLVELLASIPPEHQADLLWDKAIIRQAVRQWLPESVTRRSKVGFFYSANDLSSVHQLIYQLVLQIFPEFCDKYVETSPRLFSKTRLMKLFHQSGTESETRIEAMKKLINCMAMTIFKELCWKRFQDSAIGHLNPPSPLQLDRTFLLEL